MDPVLVSIREALLYGKIVFLDQLRSQHKRMDILIRLILDTKSVLIYMLFRLTIQIRHGLLEDGLLLPIR